MSSRTPRGGENLAARIPAVARRARVYGLEDDGASDLARRRRHAKERTARLRRSIKAAEERTGIYKSMLEERVEQILVRHRAALAHAEEDRATVGPTVRTVAPVARRVAREDRRRSRRARKKA